MKTIERSDDSPGAIESLFRKKGIRLTPQRLEIYRELMGADDHPSAEVVHKRLLPRLPAVSLDTVYRTLDLFERMGLISRVEILDDRSRYEPNTEPHHHFVCVICKRIMDFPWPAVDSLQPPPQATRWGKIFSSHLELRGVCGTCLRKQSGKAKPAP
jgi:Fur family peroxide stress response transcriptional regulator